tara:strand:- start:105 stop:500 length:396 start_codon:yes stop_codon:yes gene_type:complete
MAKKSKKLIDSVLSELLKAKTIKEVLKEHDLTFKSWSRWCVEDVELMNHYHQVKLTALDLELADLEEELNQAISKSRIKGESDMPFINAVKLKMTHLHWKLSRLNPKTYSNNSSIALKNADNEPLIIKWQV